MGLEDKFYPNGGPIISLDNAVIWCAGKMGEAYQHLTGRDYTDLETSFRGLSYSLGGVALLTGQDLGGPSVLILSAMYQKNKKYETPLEEIERHKVEGGSESYSPKHARMLTFSLGLVVFGGHAVGIYPLKEETTSEFNTGGAFIGGAMALTSLADAMTKADIPKPPSKTVFRKAYEGIKNLIRKPIPAPVPSQIALP
jgi:hypothetical protein